MNLIQKYGKTALIAGASEGIGAAFAHYLAAAGLDLILIARRLEPLELFAEQVRNTYNIQTNCISCDLATSNAVEIIKEKTAHFDVDIFVYNAALSFIGPFEKNNIEFQTQMAQANMITPMHLTHYLGAKMIEKKKGAIIIMASLAGFQGSAYLSVYGATKAFNQVFAEGLWYEWKNKGVDVMACCAGATATPNFLNTQPEKSSILAPKVQDPADVVYEAFEKLGSTASFVSGTGNKIASFFMQKVMPRNWAITIMGDTTKKMYRL